MKKALFALASLGALLMAGSVSAATVVYGSKAAFSGATGFTEVASFNDLKVGSTLLGDGLTTKKITFRVSEPGFNTETNAVLSEASDLGTYNFDGSNFLSIDLLPGSSLSMLFGRQTSSVGFDLVGLANGIRVEFLDVYSGSDLISSGSYNYPSADSFGQSFVGVVSDRIITKVVLTHRSNAVNDVFGLDNVIVDGVSGAVPEPSTWALMMLGFGAVGYAMRRRPKVAVWFA